MQTDTTAENVQRVLDAWKAFGSGDPERVAAVFAPDAEWIAPPGNATAVALGGTHRLTGRDRIVHFLTVEFPTLFVADVAVEFRHVLPAGDCVIVEETMRATLRHGGRYENDYCFVFVLRDGLITEVREYMDTLRGCRQILGEHPASPAM